jgi:hypothetical protein
MRIGAVPSADAYDLDDLNPPVPDGGGDASPLEALRAALTSPAEPSEPVTLKVPRRPGVTLICHTDMTQDQRKAWQKSATAKNARRQPGVEPEVDEWKFACLVLANTCVGIAFDGTIAHDAADQPLTFRHRQVWEMLGAAGAEGAIRNLFQKDAHVLIASGEVLIASGFDDDLKADPTEQAV